MCNKNEKKKTFEVNLLHLYKATVSLKLNSLYNFLKELFWKFETLK